MSSCHTVTGAPAGRPAHAARPGVPAVQVAAALVGLTLLVALGWLGISALLKSTGPTATTPVSASLITVTPPTATPTTSGAASR